MLGMNELWNKMCSGKNENENQYRRFVLAYTTICLVISALTSAVLGFFMKYNLIWGQAALAIIGVVGMGLGFFGSVIYTYRRS